MAGLAIPKMLLSSLVGLLAVGAAEASSLTPPTLPLVVRNPYLNAHLGNARDVPWSKWPIFWTDQEIGMSIMAALPGSHLVYPLLGRPQDSLGQSNDYNVSYPTYFGAQFDASTTNLSYSIPAPPHAQTDEALEVVVSFLSPVTPTSTLRQAIPASYVEITSSGAFPVDIYMDLNGLWVTAERGARIEWEYQEVGGSDDKKAPPLKTFRVKRAVEMKFSEIRDRAEYGKLYFTGPSDATHEVGTSADVRKRFARHGVLNGNVDGRFRDVMDEEPIFALQKSLPARSSNATRPRAALFTVAHLRDEVAQFASARGLTEMRPLWKSHFPADHELLAWHYRDHRHAALLAAEFAGRVARDAAHTGGQDHVDIVSLSARQVLGATDFAGTAEAPLLFMKEISSDGNCQTIDVIFPSFPFFAYANPQWLAYTLEPLLEHMLSGQYPNKYAMHDLGAHYPNLTGHPLGLDEYMPVEESGDMLIMGLFLVNSLVDGLSGKLSDMLPSPFAGAAELRVEEGASVFPLRVRERADGVPAVDEPLIRGTTSASQAKAWLSRSYRLWKQWTEYLIEFSLEPENQLSTDDFAGWLPLQTNLALKGIVGIRAMAEMAAVMGEQEEFEHYRNVSETYIKKWQEYGISRDGTHAKLAYNWYGSWTTLYSLFADALLCFHTEGAQDWSSELGELASPGQPQAPLSLASEVAASTSRKGKGKGENFIPHAVYRNQSLHYTLVLQKYGLPLDSRHLYAKSDWEFQVAAAASPSFRGEIVRRMARWLNETETSTPFSDLHMTEERGGYAPGTRFTARPVIGSHFSLLAMDQACGGKAIPQPFHLDAELAGLQATEAERVWKDLPKVPVNGRI